MKKKKSITGFGIGCIIVLAVVMIVRFYLKLEGEPLHIRIFEGALKFVCTFAGTAVLYLCIFVAMYAAIRASGIVFGEEGEDDKLMKYFLDLGNPILIICFVVSYILLLLY